MAVDERILARLGELGWTQKELASRVEVNPSHIAHLCSGRRSGSVKLLRRVAEVLGLDADQLVVESGLGASPGSIRHKQASLLAKARGWAGEVAP